MNRILTVVLFFLVSVIAANPLFAQDRESDDSMLPEIDPQDIEIRSQFQARFPGLRRQPILGFEPTSRVYEVDPDRMPYIESDEDRVANLPISELSRPDAPPYTPLHYSPDINAFARGGAGNYLSSEANFWGVTRLSNQSYIGGDLDFSSSDGHLENQQSSFRFLKANGEFASKLSDKTRLDLDVGLQNSFNHLFNVNSSGFDVPESPRKEYGGVNLGVELQGLQNGVEGWNVQANARYYDVETMAGDLSMASEEGVYNALLSKRWAGPNTDETFTAKLGGALGDYSNTLASNQWMTGQVGVEYSRLFNYETHIMVDASVYYGSDAFEDKIYFAPRAKFVQPMIEAITFTATVGAKPYVKTSEQLHTSNRFLNPGHEFRHSYRMYGVTELEINYSDVGTLTGGIRYEDIENYPIFERETNALAPGQPLFYKVRYDDVAKAQVFASLSHQVVPEKFWLNGKVYAQAPDVKDGGRIPFTEKLGGTSGFSLRLFDRATIQGWADYIGPRRNGRGDTLEEYILLGGQFDLSITDNIGIYAKAVNLLDQEYQKWEGYTERPMQVYGGITVKL